jgi:long-chain-fatty-acid---luciferin-component ligase
MTLPETTAGVDHQQLEPVAELDRLIFGPDPFSLSPEEETCMRLMLVRDAVARYAECDQRYAGLLRAAGVEPLHVENLDDIPQLPTSIFKRKDINLRLPGDAVASRSSGTQGSVSVVWRDNTTIQRLLGSVRAGIRLIDSWYEDEVHLVNLGPQRSEAGDLWFAYVMSLLEIVYPTTHCVSKGNFDLRESLRRVDQALDSAPRVGIVGPPALVLELARTAAARRSRVEGDRLTIVTAGGWKRATGDEIDRDTFEERVGEAFAVPDRRQLRDVFNQVELNTVLFECEAHRKHLPPWLHVTVREPRHLTPVGENTYGIMSYLDASATSFPCFVIANDVGMLENGQCDCGRVGRIIQILRRIRNDESWGCALKMDADVKR